MISRALSPRVGLALFGLVVLTTLGSGTPLLAQPPDCRPCAGLVVDRPSSVLEPVRAAELPEDAVLFVKHRFDLAGLSADPEPVWSETTPAGVRPWLAVVFRTPAPLLQNATALETELAALARQLRGMPRDSWVQILWRPSTEDDGPGELGSESRPFSEYAYLFKRATVAVSGALPAAEVVTEALSGELEQIEGLYAEELAAYVDGVALLPGDRDRLGSAVDRLMALDPGVAVVVDARPLSEEPWRALAEAAADAAAGASATLFRAQEVDAEVLRPFLLLAREFRGDLYPDPYSVPQGAERAWSFVRGEDLALRVVVELPAGESSARLRFTDPRLRTPGIFDPVSLERQALFTGARVGNGYELTVESTAPVAVVELARMTTAELEGAEEIEEQLEVSDVRQMPVEEILRRLQAFEDAQRRRLETYIATSSLSLRFQAGGGVQAIEVTYEGDFFFREGEGYDWAWQDFFVNGVRWRDRRVPQIPLIQPEKASAEPVEISFTREYRYRLRGTATVDGRDCWVVDFEPAVEVEPGESLYQGTVWIDRGVYARVRTQAVQLGLRGDVVSNDETLFYSPLDAQGAPAAWSDDSYVLPLRSVGQQIFSLLNNAVVVERERLLRDVEINPENFAERRQQVLASDVTMVRDTEEGLRYLVTDDETGERVVEEELDADRLFLVGGVLYDEAQDFPVPVAGVNWLSFDVAGTGAQANVLFGGALVIADYATPSLFGSRWEAGVDLFALAIRGTDSLYRGGEEIAAEDVETSRPNVDLTLGRPIGSFFKLELGYSLGYNGFGRADDTAPDFLLPSDHFDHRFGLTTRYNRRGYRFRLGGSYNLRSEWEAWGLPGNPDFDPEKDQYLTYGAGLAKIWHLPNFFKVGAEVEYVGGEDLDRFSKYQFGPFSDVRVRGYRSELIRAEEAWATHLSYGFNLGELFQLNLLGDAAWATDEATGLDNELLAGVGFGGTFVGPWRMIFNVDIGKAVAGPDDGWTAFVTFLKLFGR